METVDDRSFIDDRDDSTIKAISVLFGLQGYEGILGAWNAINTEEGKTNFLNIASESLGSFVLGDDTLEKMRGELIESTLNSSELPSIETNLVYLSLSAGSYVPDTMKVINMFSTLMSKGESEASLALKYLKLSLPQKRLESNHKRRLIDILKDLQGKYDSKYEHEVVEVANELNLRTLWYLATYWR